MPVKHFYIAVVLICAAILGGFYWHGKLAGSIAQHEQMKQDIEKQVEETKESDQRAEQRTRETKQAITRTSEKVQTPTDVVASLPLIHSPFAGLVTVLPPTPDAPSQLVVTDPKGFFNAAGECEGIRADLEACNVKLANSEKRARLQEARAEDAEKIMEGGGFFHRVKSGLRHSLCGAGGTASGFGVASQTSAKVGVITGAGVFVGCEVLLK